MGGAIKMTCEIPPHAACVEAVLEGIVRADVVLIAAGIVPPFPHDVRGVRYQLEPPGEEDWKLAHGVIRDGWGDCEDIACWCAAGLRATGQDEGAVVRVVRTGRGKLHAVVQCTDGTFWDPSVDLMTDADLRRYTDAA
jgi:hypothetical protein